MQVLTCQTLTWSCKFLQGLARPYKVKTRLVRQASLDLAKVNMFLQVIQGLSSYYRVLQIPIRSCNLYRVLQDLAIFIVSYRCLTRPFKVSTGFYTSGKILKVLLITGRHSRPKWQGFSACSNKSCKLLQVVQEDTLICKY